MPNWKKIIVSGSDASLSSAYVDGVSSLSEVEINTTTTGDSLLITSTEDSSGAAPVITLKRNSSSPADSDYIGQLKFKGENDADQEVVYAKITAKIKDATDGSEDGNIEFANIRGGLNVITARLSSDKLQLLNGTDLDVDGDITADNFTGTASIADFATTASHALNVPDTASHALTAITASHTAGTASISNFATSASFAITASHLIGGGGAGNSGSFSGSFQGDGSALTGITVAESTLDSASFSNVTSYTASHNLESTELTVAVYDNNNNQVLPETIRILNDANVGLDFSEATTGKVVLTKGGHIVSGSLITQVNYYVVTASTYEDTFTAATSHTASHNFGTKNVLVQVYDSSDNVIVPSNIKTNTINEVGIDFASTRTGRVIVGKAGHIVSGSMANAISSSYATNSTNATNATYMSTGSFKQPVQFIKTEPVTASLYHLHLMSASSAITMSLPEGTSGDWFKVSNMLTGSLLETYGSQNIMSASGDLTLDTANAGLELIYTDDINGWVIIGN